ncbi:hypothetical protein BC629DRAFT_1453858 [Irpex lacteus]|nr:hypothetical protein BC629DRAFT_1453858 [Irpex lacteus]
MRAGHGVPALPNITLESCYTSFGAATTIVFSIKTVITRSTHVCAALCIPRHPQLICRTTRLVQIVGVHGIVWAISSASLTGCIATYTLALL